MTPEAPVQVLNQTLAVFSIDVLLSGDNAVFIALACRSLPAGQKRQALLAGTAIAIVMRVLLTLLAGVLLQVPLLKLVGGLALTIIAIRLTVGDDGTGEDAGARQRPASNADLGAVIVTLVVADFVMSLDNVIALAAVARGSLGVLVGGLALSVPLLMFGSWKVGGLLQRHPVLIPLGGGFLGWLAGDIAVTDPLYVDALGSQAPALGVIVPALVAVYVLLQSRIILAQRASAEALRPRPRAVAAPAPALDPRPPAQAEADLDAEVETGGASVTEPQPRRARPRSVLRRRGLAAAGGVAALGLVWALSQRHWMPVPADLVHYACPGRDIGLDYRPGAQRIRMNQGERSVAGIVRPDNQIDWGDYHGASTELGLVPPSRVATAGARSVRIDGGMFDGVVCSAP